MNLKISDGKNALKIKRNMLYFYLSIHLLYFQGIFLFYYNALSFGLYCYSSIPALPPLP